MNITQEFDTIAAIATPHGTGGVGVVRISGDKSFEIINKIFSKQNLEAEKISHGWIKDNGKIIDEVIILPFKKPNSFTGEDVIEIHCHGGVNVVSNILDLVLTNGARLAERGEFTKRAFMNGKMDLSQAEAVADLIHAKTKKFAKDSANNLSGMLSVKTREIRQNIFEILSKIIAGIDFPEDVKEPEYEYLISEFEKIIKEIDIILSSAKASDIMRQGLKIAVAGRPNVGKSSLFNALLNINRAIVTDIAGTTRDVIRENLDLDVPITLIDTAGIREGADVIEKIGIKYSKQSVEEADLVLFIYDISSGFTPEDEEIYSIIKDKPHFTIANKCDLTDSEALNSDIIKISAQTKSGIEELKGKITEFANKFDISETDFVTNSRQQDCLKRCRESLENALEASRRFELQDLISIDLKSSLIYLDELTGEVITDEILENIFSHFCIGK